MLGLNTELHVTVMTSIVALPDRTSELLRKR
jgi:hypothetical protein